MGLKRVADPRLIPLWIIILAVAIAAIAYQLQSVQGDELPEPVLTKPDTDIDVESAPPRDRISPLKDGSGT
ncbi:MAG: hypothetical protein ABIV13_03315 [Fimbriimonadales bacterium]